MVATRCVELERHDKLSKTEAEPDILILRSMHQSLSKSDPEAKIAKMKDGTTHLAYKPEHAVDLDTGAVVAAELHPADEGDTTTLSKTLAKAEANLGAVDAAPTAEDPAECVADKGYHSRAVLRALDDSPWKTRIAGCVSKVVEIGFGASPSGLSFAAVRPLGQGFRRRLADRGFPIHRLCASGFGRKRGAPRGASALFRDTAARSVF